MLLHVMEAATAYKRECSEKISLCSSMLGHALISLGAVKEMTTLQAGPY